MFTVQYLSQLKALYFHILFCTFLHCVFFSFYGMAAPFKCVNTAPSQMNSMKVYILSECISFAYLWKGYKAPTIFFSNARKLLFLFRAPFFRNDMFSN